MNDTASESMYDDSRRGEDDDTQPTPALPVSAFPTKPTIEGYTLHEEVGRGGSSVVYRAERDGEPFAIKVYRPLYVNSVGVERFRREATALQQLDHPNLVKVYESGESGGFFYMVMELLDATPIRERVAAIRPEGSLETQQGSQIRWILERFEEVAAALGYLHGLGIIHRDVKPANILIDGNDRACLVDLGVAHVESEATLTMEGELLGTIAFISPEQAMAGRVDVDHRTDLYSLGASLYYCLTGTRPFESKRRQDTLRQVLLHDPMSLRRLEPSLPRDLDRVVSTCMEKDPKRRYANAETLGLDLRRVRNVQAVSVRGPSQIRRAGRWVKAHQSKILGIVVIALTPIVGLLWYTNDQAQYDGWYDIPVVRVGNARGTEISEVVFYPRWRRFEHLDALTLPRFSQDKLKVPLFGLVGIDIERNGNTRTYSLLIEPDNAAIPFIYDWYAREPLTDEFIFIDGEKPFYVRQTPLTTGEVRHVWAAAPEEHRETVFSVTMRAYYGVDDFESEPHRERQPDEDPADKFSLTLAQTAAAMQGCRLPTVAEWDAIRRHLALTGDDSPIRQTLETKPGELVSTPLRGDGFPPHTNGDPGGPGAMYLMIYGNVGLGSAEMTELDQVSRTWVHANHGDFKAHILLIIEH